MTTYRPWALFDEMQRGLETLHGTETKAWTPAVDISEDEHRYLIRADLPGVDPKEIDVNLEGDELTLRGERREEKEDKGKNWQRTERFHGEFYRRFRLPESADPEHIEAHSDKGVLEIVIPKQPKTQPRKIAINH
ncbi:MAG TPA: Hsp20/alpha crystallin family protein [Gammaproteobacteria bacterium]|nr:Hsp20/alpha crystallin family protein [Gammaproteobacteria bacterium]